VLNTGPLANGAISGGSWNFEGWSLAGGSKTQKASPWGYFVSDRFLSLSLCFLFPMR
jgi:hypothetical protein